MGNYTEILGSRKYILSKTQRVIYHLGRMKIVRHLYWKWTQKYLWGIMNFIADMGSKVIQEETSPDLTEAKKWIDDHLEEIFSENNNS